MALAIDLNNVTFLGSGGALVAHPPLFQWTGLHNFSITSGTIKLIFSHLIFARWRRSHLHC